MIGRIVIFVVVVGAVGLVVGYLIFGRVGGDYLSVKQILQSANNPLTDLAQSMLGIREARRNIWISGAIGAGLGLLTGALAVRKRG